MKIYIAHSFYGQYTEYFGTKREAELKAHQRAIQQKVETFVSEINVNGPHSLAAALNGKPVSWEHRRALTWRTYSGTAYDLLANRIRPTEGGIRDFIKADIGKPFSDLIQSGPTCGFVLLVSDGQSLREWAGEPVSYIERVECWFEPNQYIFWSSGFVDLGEWHDHEDPDLDSLPGLAALVPQDVPIEDVHAELQPLVKLLRGDEE